MKIAVLGGTGRTGVLLVHRSGRRTSLTRANLAAFIGDAVESGSYSRQAPFVTNA